MEGMTADILFGRRDYSTSLASETSPVGLVVRFGLPSSGLESDLEMPVSIKLKTEVGMMVDNEGSTAFFTNYVESNYEAFAGVRAEFGLPSQGADLAVTPYFSGGLSAQHRQLESQFPDDEATGLGAYVGVGTSVALPSGIRAGLDYRSVIVSIESEGDFIDNLRYSQFGFFVGIGF